MKATQNIFRSHGQSFRPYSLNLLNNDNTVVDRDVEFIDYLLDVDAIIENNDVHDVFMRGDFNLQPLKQFWMKLK